MSLSFGTQKSAETVTLACHGQIVAGNEGSALRQKVQQLMKDSPNVILDLRNVSYIDGSGLGVLVSLYSTARAAGGEVPLDNPWTPVTYTEAPSTAPSTKTTTLHIPPPALPAHATRLSPTRTCTFRL